MTLSSYRGYLYALIAFGTWGFLPVYWKQLHDLPMLEILAHRMVWSALTMIIALAVLKDLSWLPALRRSPRTLLLVSTAALLTAANWITYLWAVDTGHVARISLGYFINPLLSVLLARLFLGERLRRVQQVAVAIAVAGVIYLTISLGQLPWIALSLAGTFSFYGLIRKKVDISGMQFFCLEMILLLVPALLLLFYTAPSAPAPWAAFTSPRIGLLLLGTGIVSAIPLVSFGAAARLIPLSTIGLMQYLAPSTQFILGVFLYKEPFTSVQLIGYAFIWTALILYSLEGLHHTRTASDH
ncbi:MAG: EamA family transporter RarD [Caldilineaceae bacterium]|nr:EamA family transporter RarD [Caldilineaceae bacterium]